MGELAVKKHDFEEAKERIKAFSETVPADISFPEVKEKEDRLHMLLNGESPLALYNADHKVTGTEFKEVMQALQYYLISINENNAKVIKEFGEIYKALEALDVDYINAISADVKATKILAQSMKERLDNIEQTQNMLCNELSNQSNQINSLKNGEGQLYDLLNPDKNSASWVKKQFEEKDAVIESLCTKLRNVSYIAGGAMIISLIELLYLFTR